MQFRNGRTAARILLALSTAGLAILTAMLTPHSALAGDSCPRLPSKSLVIVIPEGGCQAATPERVSAASEVTIIRGPGFPRVVRKSNSEKVVRRVPGRTGSPSIIIVVNNNSVL